MMTKSRVNRTFYKVLTVDGDAPVARPGLRWSLPKASLFAGHKPGLWHTVVGKLQPCVNGLHLVKGSCRAALQYWLSNENQKRRLFVCEVQGECLPNGRGEDRKFVCRTVRLMREVTRGSAEWKLALRGTDAETWEA